jgi:hypothetical protein
MKVIDMSDKVNERSPLQVIGWLSTCGYMTIIDEPARQAAERAKAAKIASEKQPD